MSGWATGLTLFLIVMGLAYTWFVHVAVRNDEEEQHRNAGNPQP